MLGDELAWVEAEIASLRCSKLKCRCLPRHDPIGHLIHDRFLLDAILESIRVAIQWQRPIHRLRPADRQRAHGLQRPAHRRGAGDEAVDGNGSELLLGDLAIRVLRIDPVTSVQHVVIVAGIDLVQGRWGLGHAAKFRRAASHFAIRLRTSCSDAIPGALWVCASTSTQMPVVYPVTTIKPAFRLLADSLAIRAAARLALNKLPGLAMHGALVFFAHLFAIRGVRFPAGRLAHRRPADRLALRLALRLDTRPRALGSTRLLLGHALESAGHDVVAGLREKLWAPRQLACRRAAPLKLLQQRALPRGDHPRVQHCGRRQRCIRLSMHDRRRHGLRARTAEAERAGQRRQPQTSAKMRKHTNHLANSSMRHPSLTRRRNHKALHSQPDNSLAMM
mmetsp:Transcript_87782/g.251492  ORF Transcript_87782/g.251492 Transcript_87782/m.251492 type:complete len:392 (+) Transcript_87782:220-1395(+)